MGGRINLVVEQTLTGITGLSPLRLMEHAGFRPDIAAGSMWQYAVECPVCHEQALIKGDRITCQPACPMRYARLVDLIARQVGGRYKAIPAMLEQRVRGLRSIPLWRESGAIYCQNAQRLRWLSMLAHGDIKQADTARMAQIDAWANKMRMHHLLDDRTAILIDAQTVGSIYLTVGSMPLFKGEALGIFYWIDAATPVAVRLLDPHNERIINFMPFGAAISGMHLPADSRVLRGRLADITETEPGVRQEMFMTSSGVIGPMEDLVIPDSGNTMAWPSWGKLFTACPNCKLRTPQGDISRDAYVRQVLLARTADDQWPLQCTTMVECLEPSRECLDEVQAELRARGLMRAAAGLRGARLTAVIYSDNRWRLLRTPAGYAAQDVATNDERALTNFCLDPLHNVVFAETAEVEHEMTLDLPGITASVRVAGTDLQTASKLQEALRLHTAKTQVDGLPTVVDTALSQKLLLPWLRRQAAALEQRPGRAMLGWTLSRDTFQSSGWRLSADSYQEVPVVLKTSIATLSCFDSSPQPSVPLPENLPQPARDLLAVVAALMARYYVRSKVRAVSVMNGGPARVLCRALFRGFGQVREYELTTFRNNQSLPGIEGHPLLATGYNSAQAEACAIPAVFLTDTGYAVQPFDETALSLITACARWTLQRVAEWLISTEGREVAERPAFRWTLGLMEEGAIIMRQACHLEAWEITAPELPALQRWAGSLQPENCGACLEQTEDGRLRIMSPQGGPDVRDLALELLLLGIPSACESTYLLTQAGPFTALLSDYWGRPPMLAEAHV